MPGMDGIGRHLEAGTAEKPHRGAGPELALVRGSVTEDGCCLKVPVSLPPSGRRRPLGGMPGPLEMMLQLVEEDVRIRNSNDCLGLRNVAAVDETIPGDCRIAKPTESLDLRLWPDPYRQGAHLIRFFPEPKSTAGRELLCTPEQEHDRPERHRRPARSLHSSTPGAATRPLAVIRRSFFYPLDLSR